MIERKRVVALDAALKAMFRVLEGRRVPERLRMTVEELERLEAPKPKPQREQA